MILMFVVCTKWKKAFIEKKMVDITTWYGLQNTMLIVDLEADLQYANTWLYVCKFVSSLVVFSVAAFTCFHLWPMAWMVLCPMRKTASGQDSSGWGLGISSSWSTEISQHSMQNFKKFCCLKYYFS